LLIAQHVLVLARDLDRLAVFELAQICVRQPDLDQLL